MSAARPAARDAATRQAPIIVRDAAEADMPAVQAIYTHHVLNGLGSFEETAPDLDEMLRRRAGIVARGLPYLVAEADSAIAGFAYGAPYRPRPAYRYTVEDSIYVGPAAQRRGVGRALLGALIERCTALGFRQMVSVIGDSNNAASIKLHESLGFRQAGALRAVGWKFGGWVDSVLMQRPLGGGENAGPPRRA